MHSKTELNLAELKSLRPQHSSTAVERLEIALEAYLKTVSDEFQQTPEQTRAQFMDDGFGSETMPIFAIAEELGKLNEENFESRRRALSQSVVNLQNDIWETLLTALVLGAIIAGASVFRISSLEKESAAHQKVSEWPKNVCGISRNSWFHPRSRSEKHYRGSCMMKSGSC